MEAVKHDVMHLFQTAEVNCGYTALAMQLSHYGSVLTPEDIYRSGPRAVADGVELPGSLATQLAGWALGQGYKARLTTFDFLIIDLALREPPVRRTRKRGGHRAGGLGE